MKKQALSLIFGIFILSGCIDSPLFNHADAAGIKTQPLTENTKCPLELKAFDLCASLTWTSFPSNDEKGTFTLRFWNRATGTESGPYITPERDVFVKLWMPSMGHGSSPVTLKPAIDSSRTSIPGVFEASDVFFVMPGAWEIWIQLREQRTVLDQAKIDVQI